MSETELIRALQTLSRGEIRLFRNNTGKLQDTRSGRWVDFGLCHGSSDLIGWRTVIITADMVGKPFAQFVAIEAKSRHGRVRPEQAAFIAVVQGAGGQAGVVRSKEEAALLLSTIRPPGEEGHVNRNFIGEIRQSQTDPAGHLASPMPGPRRQDT